MTSPQLEAASRSTRTEEEARAAVQARISMWQAIQNGVKQTIAADPRPLPCPHCHTTPSIEDGFHGQFVVFCDSDACSGYGERQAMGKTAAEAIALWNEREATDKFVCPRCKQNLEDADEAEGCEDLCCPLIGGMK